MTKICIPIVEETNKEVLKKMNLAKKSGADLFEIWLGHIENPDIPLLIKSSSLPVIINCKGEDEQGNFIGTEKEKAEILIEAAQAGAAYVDIHFRSSSKIIEKISEKRASAKLILSAHFFKGTPGLPHLTSDLQKMLVYKPDIVKFAALPRNLKDVVTLIRLAEKLISKNIPHIVISLGKLGKITRIASPILGNEIMFAPLDESSASVLGQIPAAELKKAFSLFF